MFCKLSTYKRITSYCHLDTRYENITKEELKSNIWKIENCKLFITYFYQFNLVKFYGL